MLFFGLIIAFLMTLVVYAAYIFIIAFTMWMAVDAAKQDRFWWVVLVIGAPIIGPAVYFFTEKKHEYVKIESHHVHTSETEAQHEHAPKAHTHHEAKHEVKEEVNVEEKKEQVVEEKKA